MGGERYDIIIVGSGPGGAGMAWRLAQTGKRILLIERGCYLKREPENWASERFVNGHYVAERTWTAQDGSKVQPLMYSYVGGNSKFFGSVLFRLREQDFSEIRYPDGVSPAWPVGYDEFEPYYQKAEGLYHVHGQRGEDPTEPWTTTPYPYPPVSHEPHIAELADSLSREGLHPFHLPTGVLLTEDEHGHAAPGSPCIKCGLTNGFPCPTNGKADAQVICVDPALRDWPNLTLSTNTDIDRLVTDATGRVVTGVVGTKDGEPFEARADIVVVACGALLSALLLLRSTSDIHPNGLANASGQVGRNYLRQNITLVLGISRTPNPTRHQKTMGMNDYYLGNPDRDDDFPFPLGNFQLFGKLDGVMIRGQGLPNLLQWLPEAPFDVMADHCVSFECFSEDLPKPENRIYYKDGGVRLDLFETNLKAHKLFRQKMQNKVSGFGMTTHLLDRTLFVGRAFGYDATTHQAGTIRFGDDPITSVLDRWCKTHELDNLYVTDGSFFPSVGAVNPTLTIIANALRVADHIAARITA
ncbi:FAD-dependent oxidoreductase [Novosphingopyxis sp.]|uniref:FAD-dependent oxidoreductase n=1 Tax=Novosphingopyxis sp. TaxID=2709690 RepID=UPI003B5A9366